MHPALKGTPLVTGKERGIISLISYEAKALGIKRGVSLRNALRIYPGLAVLPSDYESYSIHSKRMFEIIRHYTPEAKEHYHAVAIFSRLESVEDEAVQTLNREYGASERRRTTLLANRAARAKDHS